MIDRRMFSGMELFQYKIAFIGSNSTLASVCNNSRLEGSEFARFVADKARMHEGNSFVFRGQYCRNNFNDYFSSLILLFELTVVNQWHGKTAISYRSFLFTLQFWHRDSYW